MAGAALGRGWCEGLKAKQGRQEEHWAEVIFPDCRGQGRTGGGGIASNAHLQQGHPGMPCPDFVNGTLREAGERGVSRKEGGESSKWRDLASRKGGRWSGEIAACLAQQLMP